jgi:hypothetical protein
MVPLKSEGLLVLKLGNGLFQIRNWTLKKPCGGVNPHGVEVRRLTAWHTTPGTGSLDVATEQIFCHAPLRYGTFCVMLPDGHNCKVKCPPIYRHASFDCPGSINDETCYHCNIFQSLTSVTLKSRSNQNQDIYVMYILTRFTYMYDNLEITQQLVQEK